MRLRALSSHSVVLGAFDLSLVPNFFVYTINRTKSSKSLLSRTVRWPRKSRASRRRSEVLPRLRSRLARRRDEHHCSPTLSFGWLATIAPLWRTICAGESAREEHLWSCAVYCSLSLASSRGFSSTFSKHGLFTYLHLFVHLSLSHILYTLAYYSY